jgi:hypothetical protein
VLRMDRRHITNHRQHTGESSDSLIDIQYPLWCEYIENPVETVQCLFT